MVYVIILIMVSLTNKENQKSHVLIPVLLSVCAIPISMLFWLINVIYSVFYSDTKNHLEGIFTMI